MNFRNLRVAKLIEEELSRIIMKELEFDGALVTITGVEVLKDLSRAKIKLAILPAEKAPSALTAISESAGRLRHLLLKKINIKPMPRLVFELDSGTKTADNFDKTLLKK